MTLGIDATLLYDDPTPDGQLSSSDLESTARTTRGSTPGCRRRRSRAPAPRPSMPRCTRPTRRTSTTCCAVPTDTSGSAIGYAASSCGQREPVPWPTAACRTRVAGGTRTVGVIGWPVAHSLSPAIHNAAFIALGLDWVYVPMPVPPDGLAAALAGLPALGFAGANVTMPHKTEAAELCRRPVGGRRAPGRREHPGRRAATASPGTTPTRRGSTGSCGVTPASTPRAAPP